MPGMTQRSAAPTVVQVHYFLIKNEVNAVVVKRASVPRRVHLHGGDFKA